jgi:hypothetical protein
MLVKNKPAEETFQILSFRQWLQTNRGWNAEATKLTALPLTNASVIKDIVIELYTHRLSMITAILGGVSVCHLGSSFNVQSITHCSTYHFTQHITW